MVGNRCPQCKTNISIRWWPGNFRQWRSGKQKCPSCGAWFELSNPLLFGGFCGALGAGLIASSRHWNFDNEWLRMVTVVFLCWAIMSVTLRLVGRWRVLADGLKESIRVQRWSRVISISSSVSVIIIIITSINLRLQVRRLMAVLSTAEPEVVMDAAEHFPAIIRLSWIGFAIAGLALAVTIIASMMRNKARIADSQGDLQ